MYTYTWKKYLPVIRILMKRSATAEQTVTLNRTDFEKTTKLRKPTCSFSVEIARGRLAGVNPPVPARDLLTILQEDETVRELIRQRQYAVSLTNDFLLTIKDITPAQAETAVQE
jgi:hypothetical protein